MEVKVILLGCVLLAICLSYLPMGDAVPCDADGQPADCDPAEPAPAPSPVPEPPAVTQPPAGAGTTAATGTATTAAPAAGKKTRTKRKWKVVRKKGKTVIKRRRTKG